MRDLLANWERFVNAESDIDPLIRMAVQHYQFEAIHPFGDGNGRTGRILNLLFLVQAGLARQDRRSISAAISCARGPTIMRLLPSVTRNGEWERWVLYHSHRRRRDRTMDQQEGSAPSATLMQTQPGTFVETRRRASTRTNSSSSSLRSPTAASKMP